MNLLTAHRDFCSRAVNRAAAYRTQGLLAEVSRVVTEDRDVRIPHDVSRIRGPVRKPRPIGHHVKSTAVQGKNRRI